MVCIHIKKHCFKWISIDFFHYLMYINYYGIIYLSTLLMESLIIHNWKIYMIDGQYLCKWSSYFMFTRWIHKFWIWLHMTTWFLDKIGCKKFANPKHVIFERSCKLHQIWYALITNYLWLLSITFIKCNPIVWRPTQYVE
jgi:hypothetical protein